MRISSQPTKLVMVMQVSEASVIDATSDARDPTEDFESVPDLIQKQVLAGQDRIALVCGDQRASYTDLWADTDRVAAALIELGVQRGSNVVLLAPLNIQGIAAMLGILACGACVVPLPISASTGQLQGMIVDCEAVAVLVSESLIQLVQGVERRISSLRPDSVRIIEQILDLPCASPQTVTIGPTDPFNIIYSSGTTGAPNGIVYDHAVRWFQAIQAAVSGVNRDSAILLSTPLYSNTTLAGGLLQSLTVGAKLVLMEKFDAREFLALCVKEKVTHATLVPVQCQRLLELSNFELLDLSQVTLRITAAPMTTALKREIAERFSGGVHESYGFTELGAGAGLNLKEYPNKLHTVGQPRSHVELKIIDTDNRELSQGATGEIVGRSKSMMIGYFKRPELTAALRWVDAEGRVFYRSGDIGRFDEDGYLIITDRKKDVIISGGFNIYPTDIEEVLAQHPAILECSVVGVPSQRWGESPLAVVVLNGQLPVTEEELQAWVNERVGKMQRVVAVEFYSELPRGPVGKILKRQLRDEITRKGAHYV